MNPFLAILIIVGICFALLSVKLFFGKEFVHTDIKGNKPLNDKGINCVVEDEIKTINSNKIKTKK
ncbi:hypothetical protein C7Y71_000570 [Pseudoprevotella muciniphila]|uniref:Uncharacterized protein n=1 Tax=Pseudoprevotella muciniphila TaxID=2133944 RepID=A0A5P8E3V5_9BACT|nr:hypothetical protein C7Y71_000570 [Pseudoprevotella muciniphila]